MAPRPFNSFTRVLPALNASDITPSDSTTLDACRALYVGSGGDLNVRFRGNQATVVLAGVAGGSLLPIDVDIVLNTSTTASSIVRLW